MRLTARHTEAVVHKVPSSVFFGDRFCTFLAGSHQSERVDSLVLSESETKVPVRGSDSLTAIVLAS